MNIIIEDEDECYQESEKDEIIANLRVGCMKNVDIGKENGTNDDQYEEMLEPLTTVDFSGRGLKVDSAQDAKEIIDEINNCERLVTLRLSGNTLSPEGAAAISEAIKGREELQEKLSIFLKLLIFGKGGLGATNEIFVSRKTPRSEIIEKVKREKWVVFNLFSELFLAFATR